MPYDCIICFDNSYLKIPLLLRIISCFKPYNCVSINHHHQVILIAWIPLNFYQLLPLVSPIHGIRCLYKVDKCKFLLVCQHWCVHVLELIGKCSFLILQQCLVCHTWMVCKMGGKWLYSYCFVNCYFLDLFKIACNIFV